jgi:hypothetical protein
MNRVTSSFAVFIAASLSQGCASTQPVAQVPAPSMATAAAPLIPPSASCRGSLCAAEIIKVAKNIEIPIEKDAPALEGHPVTSVVVTQCNLIVAVYVTMPDGRLLRFDHNTTVPPGELLQMAYSATRSERVEVACDDTEGAVTGAVGFEKHEPI